MRRHLVRNVVWLICVKFKRWYNTTQNFFQFKILQCHFYELIWSKLAEKTIDFTGLWNFFYTQELP